jgi:hypothetical protein
MGTIVFYHGQLRDMTAHLQADPQTACARLGRLSARD